MSRSFTNEECFDYICEQLSGSLEKQANTNAPLSVKLQVAITIYWLATTAEYRTVAHLFGVGKSTAATCVHDVCNALMEKMAPEVIKFPVGDELREVLKGYDQIWGFPHCAGAIDGSHIPIIAPSQNHGDYLNRKGFYSIVLQAVCDFRYIFTDIMVGWPGRAHDARIFANSEIFHKGMSGTLFPKWKKRLDIGHTEADVPVVLIGDPAYPLRSWLMKPFADRGNLTPSQTHFNYRLSRARMTIENSFGRLKGRWKRLQKRMDVDVEFASVVVAASVVLHNICELRKEQFREEWIYADGGFDTRDYDNVEEFQNRAKHIRDDICTFLDLHRL